MPNPDYDRVRALVGGNIRGECEQWATRALGYLELARTAARNAGSRNTLKRIDHAISSAKGAVRAGHYRDIRRAGG